VLCFANQVGNHPMIFADVEISHSESLQFCASQSTPDEKGENRSVTLSAQVVWRRLAKQGPGLLHRQPVANPHAQPFHSLDTPDASRQVRAEKATVGGFVGEPPHGRKANVDGRGCEVSLFERKSVTKDDGSV
jgi:hypothetical protein